MTHHAPLAVYADLSLLAADGQAITVTATESVITVTLPRLWSRQWALGPLADPGRRQLLLARLQRALQVADLTLQFRVRQLVVAQLSPQSRPTLMSRLLGLGPVQVRALASLRALLPLPSAARSS